MKRLISGVLIACLIGGCTTVNRRSMRAAPSDPGALEGTIVGVVLAGELTVEFAEPGRLHADGSVCGRPTASAATACYEAGEIQSLFVEESHRKPKWSLIGVGAAAGLTVLFLLFINWVEQFE